MIMNTWIKTVQMDKSLKRQLAPVRNNLARSLRQCRKLCKNGERYTYEGGIQFGICLGEQSQILAAERAAQDVRINTMNKVYATMGTDKWIGD